MYAFFIFLINIIEFYHTFFFSVCDISILWFFLEFLFLLHNKKKKRKKSHKNQLLVDNIKSLSSQVWYLQYQMVFVHFAGTIPDIIFKKFIMSAIFRYWKNDEAIKVTIFFFINLICILFILFKQDEFSIEFFLRWIHSWDMV